VFFLATWSSSGSSSSLCNQDTVYNIIIIKRRIFCMLRQTRSKLVNILYHLVMSPGS
jgi:hypothetical protein